MLSILKKPRANVYHPYISSPSLSVSPVRISSPFSSSQLGLVLSPQCSCTIVLAHCIPVMCRADIAMPDVLLNEEDLLPHSPNIQPVKDRARERKSAHRFPQAPPEPVLNLLGHGRADKNTMQVAEGDDSIPHINTSQRELNKPGLDDTAEERPHAKEPHYDPAPLHELPKTSRSVSKKAKKVHTINEEDSGEPRPPPSRVADHEPLTNAASRTSKASSLHRAEPGTPKGSNKRPLETDDGHPHRAPSRHASPPPVGVDRTHDAYASPSEREALWDLLDSYFAIPPS